MPATYAIQTVIFALNAGIIGLLLSEGLKLPALVLYLILGILLGPFFLNLVQPRSLGPMLPVIIELGVALIMFEGAMHLNIRQYRSASKAIRNLLTVGLTISVICITLLTHWLFHWPWGICLLFGVLMSVTGPTVIAPILRKLPLKSPIGNILHWESILLEPIVVIGATLIVEFLIQVDVTLANSLFRLFRIILTGATIGLASGYLVAFFLKKFPITTEGFRNLLVVGIALLIFEVSNLAIAESGLVAVVFAGVVLGNSPVPDLYGIKQFKEIITRTIIAFIFILLSADLDWDLLITFTIPIIFFLVAIIFIVRPLVVFISTANSGLTNNAKIFISLTAPRGIVAASMVALFTLVFAKHGSEEARAFEILAYQLIFITIFVQAMWSRPLASLLKVKAKEKTGYLIIGSHPLGTAIATWMKEKGTETLLVDRNSYDIYLAKKSGLNAHKGDALNEYFLGNLRLENIGNLLALTSNDEVNTLACQLGKRFFGHERIFQIHKRLKEKDEGFLKTASGIVVFPKLPPLHLTLEQLQRGQLKCYEGKGIPGDDAIPLFVYLSNGSLLPVTTETKFDKDSVFFAMAPIRRE